jgi:anti-sigma factor RsiW
MNDDVRNGVSYDRLNAFVDGQLDRAEEGRLLEAIQREPALERRVSELRRPRI